VPRKFAWGEAGGNIAYGYNYQYLGNSRANCWNVPVTESQIQTPSHTIAIADSRGTGTRPCDNDEPTDPDFVNLDCLFNHGYSIDPPVYRLVAAAADQMLQAAAGDGASRTTAILTALISPSAMVMPNGCG